MNRRSLSAREGPEKESEQLLAMAFAEAEVLLAPERERALLEAVCTCLLDDREPSPDPWVPSSIAELERDHGDGHTRRGADQRDVAKLLKLGLCSLDEFAAREGGCRFECLERPAQLRLLSQLEEGKLALCRALGVAILDRLLELTARAYLSSAIRRRCL